MSWQNAPKLTKLTASQQGGIRGAQLWGVDYKGKLYTIYQGSPGGGWSDWKGGGWNDPNEPKGIYELAASQTDPDGRVYFWAIDLKGTLWARWQNSPGGNWGPWKKDFNRPSGAANKFTKIAATRGGGKGLYLFGIFESGTLGFSYSILPAGNFSPWTDFSPTPEKSRFIEVTACQQKDGRAAVWALDEKRQLWGAGQISAGMWGGWAGPNWLKAPKLRNIAAVEGMNGAIISGQDENYHFTSNFQLGPGRNDWRGWQTPSEGEMRSFELTAAGQNNGVAQIWAITLGGKLTTLTQKENNHWNPTWSDADKDSELPKPPEPKKK
jgi:hypothetical protein